VEINNPSGVDGVYTNVYPSGGSGTNSVFEINVSDGYVSGINITDGGKEYLVEDVLNVDGSVFGGVSGTDDLTITVTLLNSNPVVYTTANATLIKNSDNENKLYYLGVSGIETVDIDRSFD
jgi:hypothetical protein